jgi:hypothetical protein
MKMSDYELLPKELQEVVVLTTSCARMLCGIENHLQTIVDKMHLVRKHEPANDSGGTPEDAA